MGVVKVLAGTLSDVLAGQWKSVIAPDGLDGRTLVAPGVRRDRHAAGHDGSTIANGSVIYVPENAVAFILNQEEIEFDIDTPGGFEYQFGRQRSIFNRDGFDASVKREFKRRLGFGGEQPMAKRVTYVNMRELDGIRFGTKGPVRLDSGRELRAHGTFTVRAVDAERVLRELAPTGSTRCTLDDAGLSGRLTSGFQQAFAQTAVELASGGENVEHALRTAAFADAMRTSNTGPSTWEQRWGLRLTSVNVESARVG